MKEESIIRNVEVTDDNIIDNTIRPESLEEYIGQKDVKENNTLENKKE